MELGNNEKILEGSVERYYGAVNICKLRIRGLTYG